MDKSKFAKRLRELRKERQLTQEELAEKLGIDTSLLDDLEAPIPYEASRFSMGTCCQGTRF